MFKKKKVVEQQQSQPQTPVLTQKEMDDYNNEGGTLEKMDEWESEERIRAIKDNPFSEYNFRNRAAIGRHSFPCTVVIPDSYTIQTLENLKEINSKLDKIVELLCTIGDELQRKQ